ncbi:MULTISPECIES: phage major capsid protein [Rhodomicrobium]|uniref:phage major capsid protein n=1 Tax=Rhodomicrobium TaxID=1068 RepID=UPI000B4BBFF2|nr:MULTISPECIES: phage major capsid protein [Rhodomicrobium]
MQSHRHPPVIYPLHAGERNAGGMLDAASQARADARPQSMTFQNREQRPALASVFPEIKAAIDENSKAFDEYRSTSQAIQADLVDRIETIEAKGANPRNPGAGGDAEAREHKARFEAWLRKPSDPRTISALGEFQDGLAKKDMTIGSDPNGGFAVPQQIAADIERLELKLSPVRRLVKIVQAGTSDFHHIVSVGGTESGWSSETGTRSATATPQLRDVAPTQGELYAYPTVSNWSLDDVFFDLSAFLTEEIATEFAFQEGLAVISGNGSNRPTGMLNTTPVLTADGASPLRAQDAYQYVNSDADVDDSPAPIGISANALIDLVYTVNSAYRSNANWIMNSATAGAIRKLKTADGRYIWGDSLIVGQPASLLGYPVEIMEQMPDIGANAFPVGFGDFRRGYLLMDRVGLRITRDEVTTPGLTKFYVRRREGGRPLNNDAVKFLRTIQ